MYSFVSLAWAFSLKCLLPNFLLDIFTCSNKYLNFDMLKMEFMNSTWLLQPTDPASLDDIFRSKNNCDFNSTPVEITVIKRRNMCFIPEEVI